MPGLRELTSRSSRSRPASGPAWSTAAVCCGRGARWPRWATPSSTGVPGRKGDPAPSRNWGRAVAWRRRASESALAAVDAREVEAAARAGDDKASEILQDAIAACAAGVASLVLSFYPDTVVIGGGLGRREDFFGPLRDMVMARPEHYPDDLVIVPSALGDDAGLAGAAAWEAATRPPEALRHPDCRRARSPGHNVAFPFSQALPSKGTLSSIRFSKLQRNCNDPPDSGGGNGRSSCRQ